MNRVQVKQLFQKQTLDLKNIQVKRKNTYEKLNCIKIHWQLLWNIFLNNVMLPYEILKSWTITSRYP